MLVNPVAVAVLGQGFAEIVRAPDLSGGSSTGDPVLHPWLAELDVPQPAQAASVPNAFGSTGVNMQNDRHFHSKITKHALDADPNAGALNQTIVSCFSGR